MSLLWEHLWLDINIATMDHQCSMITNAALAVVDGKIAWLGAEADLPTHYQTQHTHHGHGCWVTPGLIDCHTHLVHAGNRAHEFEWRLQGKSYVEIAEAGGGIKSTVNATRLATENELFQLSAQRLQHLLREGVTTLEIKSGYGLDLNTELKMLRVARQLAQAFPVTIKTTLLGAHVVPLEYKDRADAYIEFVCDELLPQACNENLVDAVDVFCDTIAFTRAQAEKIFIAARNFNLPVKIHAEQLSNQHGAALAASYGALSADHLEFLDEAGAHALQQAGTVAVLLPGAYYFLQEKQMPPIELLRKYNIPMALASDCNPGTSPISSLLLILNMACVLFRLTPDEALLAVTRHAAQALGLLSTHGTLEVNKIADFVLWDVEHPRELCYRLGFNPAKQIIKDGEIV